MTSSKQIQKASDQAIAMEFDQHTTARVVESMVLRGDISALSPETKAQFYIQMCNALGLTAATQPLAVLRLNGKEVLYVTRGATDQLAAIHRLTRRMVDGPKVIDLAGTKLVFAVCEATHPNGRVETATATVPLTDHVNVLMKAETKAKRRATLSILGLGMLDETEVETIPANVQQAGRTPTREEIDNAEREPAKIDRELSAAKAIELPTAFTGELAAIELPAEAVSVWIKHRAELAILSPDAKEAAWKMACARVESIGSMKNAKVWLKRAIAEEDARRLVATHDEDGVALDAETASVAPAPSSAELEAEARYQGGPSAPQTPAANGRDPLSTPNAKAFIELLSATNSTDGVVAAWLRYGHTFASEGSDVLRACFNEGVKAYVAYGGLGREEFKSEIDRARASADTAAQPADTKPRTKSRKTAAAPLAASIDCPSPSAWEARIGRDANAGHIAGGFWKRAELWRAEGTLARARSVTVDRLCTLLGRDESDASRWLDGCAPEARRNERREAETDRRRSV